MCPWQWKNYSYISMHEFKLLQQCVELDLLHREQYFVTDLLKPCAGFKSGSVKQISLGLVTRNNLNWLKVIYIVNWFYLPMRKSSANDFISSKPVNNASINHCCRWFITNFCLRKVVCKCKLTTKHFIDTELHLLHCILQGVVFCWVITWFTNDKSPPPAGSISSLLGTCKHSYDKTHF